MRSARWPDYIAMLALSQAASYEKCQDVPTHYQPDGVRLRRTACSRKGITDIDATYLRGLYKMDAGRSLLGERSSIAYEMKKDLGGY